MRSCVETSVVRLAILICSVQRLLSKRLYFAPPMETQVRWIPMSHNATPPSADFSLPERFGNDPDAVRWQSLDFGGIVPARAVELPFFRIGLFT